MGFSTGEKKAEIEQWKRSNLTEKHSQLVCYRIPSSSSDSTKNNNKRNRHTSSIDNINSLILNIVLDIVALEMLFEHLQCNNVKVGQCQPGFPAVMNPTAADPTAPPPPQQPIRSSFSCDRHPDEKFNGFCPSCPA
ncbi:Protein OCTOPUS-like [Forsythia ovata]|uniref:Protein OCTOPUS-like n=1 Tax=Forsythia ovata TaxID=205694 RepID=A0ABD1WXY6_9LAMI